MDPRTQERAEQWDSRPFSGGYDGLTDLADSDFSGAVTAAGTWLFMLNGRIVGVVDGAIEDFENASGTVYEAPHPSLPLLCTMEAQGGETRAKYYTNETPLREVDGTLQDGSFTGYVELSENVLSGDYYAVYYGGRRMAAAYIGNAERLLTGDEAFERADDEVGIYEVRDVDIEVTDVPGTDADAGGSDGAGVESDFDSGSGVTAPSDAITDAEPESTVTDVQPDAGADAHDEPSADPTESPLESIDLTGSDPDTASADETAASASIEDITLDETSIDDATAGSSDAEATDEPSGITASEDADLEASSSGITASDPALDSPAEDPASIESETEPTAPVDESVTTSFEDVASDSTPERDDGAESVDESATESAGTTGSTPDLAEVEAAAEQLDQNDISWTEDDVDSSDDDETTEETESDVTAESSTQRARASADQPASEENDERFEEEAQWRETRSIPSIDPDNTQPSESNRESAASRGTTQRTGARRQTESAATGSADNSARDTSAPSAPSSGSGASSTQERTSQQNSAQRRQQTERAESDSGRGTANAAGSGPEQRQRIATLTEQLETTTEQRDALVSKYEELEAERDRLRSENEELTSTVDRLQSRIAELEADLERARAASSDAGDAASETPTASTQLSPQRALAETNLFVRYVSKSQPTLETAHDGNANRDEVAANLRLEHHTSFDAADVAVDGVPYGEFLTATMEYRFVDWLTETVLYEVRDTGNADALGDLYHAIPRIDRAELGASISLADDETEDVPDEVTFDVVAFDKMGTPLVVANLNDSRDPATQGMLEEMEEAASAVKANYPDLAAAVVVTSSYFDPGALEVAEQATGGGFLSRGSKLSYVNLSRKEGYHLCLVEARSEGFHMNVPEL